jgi:hypothetical protein
VKKEGQERKGMNREGQESKGVKTAKEGKDLKA